MSNPSEIKCKWLKIEEIRKITDKIRSKYWPENTYPINIEKIIESRIGLDIIPEPSLKMDAYLRSDSGIAVNQEQYMDSRYDNRLRFSLAHELGHFILHKDICDNFKFNSEEEYIEFYNTLSEQDYQGFECQANEFAGGLLVPREILINQVEIIFNETYDILKKNNRLDLLETNTQEIFMRQSEKIARFFGVSTRVIEIRVLEREKIWPPY
ncbi:ImmA/IrrE family metallo-endopeptidase [Candidatus Latescibacterota bacterium]